jgi:hypothetical protein
MSESYAASVIEVLRPHFPEATSADADVLTWWIGHDHDLHDPAAEFIVDDPIRARWRLRPDPADRRRVRLCYYPVTPPGSEADLGLERAVNEALSAIVTAREA